MSKLVTQRFEYALYDDAQGVLSPAKDVPPTYPPALDSYRVSTTISTAQSYGTQNVSGSTGAVPFSTPANATLTIFSPVTNTYLLGVTVTNAVLTVNGTPTTATFYCAPGQTITIPSSINSGILTVGPYTLALVSTSQPFTANVTWNL